MNEKTNRMIVLLSPFFIIAINFTTAFVAGHYIGKWAFIPIILIEWVLFALFVLKFAGIDTVKAWLGKRTGAVGWVILALAVGLIPLPLFILHYSSLASWEVFIPWILLALINPWLEEFYWRGLLMKYTEKWPAWLSILFTGFVFAGNHAVFGVNSVLNSGPTIIVATLVMGLIWALVYHKTKSLRWVIFAHFLTDFFNMSAASFLDLYKAGW
ncbi:MAG: CPBP family intramembrane metalloprotease [Spirochaetales bacterium]|nr:CPBP family intramembrane metalloprotease [Spirochaetales bacterium]